MSKYHLKRISVNRQNVVMNAKDHGKRPTITCKSGKDNHKGILVEIMGPCVIVDGSLNGKKPLACGARVWIETYAAVFVDGVCVI